MNLLQRIFSINLRSLAIFRILAGFILLIDVVNRWLVTPEFYSDYGVLPRSVYLEKFANLWKFSLHLANGQIIFIQGTLIIAALFAFGLLIGYRSRLCTFVSWLLMISLQVRNPVILSGADDLFRLLLFWSLFLPLGAKWSVDQALTKTTIKQKEVFNIGSIGFILQLLYMYIFTAVLKNHPIWIQDGTAILYALQIDLFTTPLGKMLLNFPTLLKWMTFGVLLLEFFGPVLFLIPSPKQTLRTLVVFAFISFHFGLSQTMYLGTFPWIAIIAWLALLPGDFLDLITNKFTDKIKKISLPSLAKLFTFKKPEVPSLQLQSVTQYFGIFSLILITVWNINNLEDKNEKLPAPFWHIGIFLQLNQRWDMFAPYPWREDGWYVIDAELVNGKHVDPLRGGAEVNFAKPEDVAHTMPNTFWRKYLVNLWNKKYSGHRLYFAKYLCRSWNDQHPKEDFINTFKIYYMLETTPGLNSAEPEPKQNQMWRHYCLSKPTDWE